MHNKLRCIILVDNELKKPLKLPALGELAVKGDKGERTIIVEFRIPNHFHFLINKL